MNEEVKKTGFHLSTRVCSLGFVCFCFVFVFLREEGVNYVMASKTNNSVKALKVISSIR